MTTLGVGPPKTHSLRKLWTELEEVGKSRDPEGWQEVAGKFTEFVEIVHDVDPGSMTFRYPVDHSGKKFDRPEFLNLDAISQWSDEFEILAGVFVELTLEAASR